MKKTVAAAVAAAFVVGTASTTFAAVENPFRDVPTNHWAYQSVERLRQAGIIEGYTDQYGNPNGIFDGQRAITRYEMAQMIAKAMARFGSMEGTGSSRAANKAELDRLAAEFRDELDALGVRVAELEKYADKVVWTGELRYRYWKDETDRPGGGKDKPSNNQLQLRLFPTAEVNDHWKLKARMTATAKMHDDTSGDFNLTYAFAEGTYNKFQLNVGKMPFYTNVDDGMLIDDFFSGAAITFGNQFKVALMAGRWDETDDPASYQGGEISYDNDRLYIGAGYHHFNSDDFRNAYNEDDANVWTVGARYKFGGDVTLGGAYAQNTKADDYDKSWYAGLQYKGANRRHAGTWGIGAHYRYISSNVSLVPTYDTWFQTLSKKGVEVGVDWAPLTNTYVKLGYFWGKTLNPKEDTNTFFGRVSWFF